MTNRVVIGADPGITGAIAAICDGTLAHLWDMPTRSRTVKVKRKGISKEQQRRSVNPFELASNLRTLKQKHPGAYFVSIVEKVSARPGEGVSSVFQFGQSYGILLGVLGALGIPIEHVSPDQWKKFFRVAGKPAKRKKGEPKPPPKEGRKAHEVAIEKHANAAQYLQRAKDHGRADAILLAQWGNETAYGDPDGCLGGGLET